MWEAGERLHEGQLGAARHSTHKPDRTRGARPEAGPRGSKVQEDPTVALTHSLMLTRMGRPHAWWSSSMNWAPERAAT